MFTKGFPQNKQITYSSMIWLVVAQIVVMLPLMFRLPLWLIPILIFSAGWRIRVMQGHLTQPGNLLKLVISALGVGALAVSGIPMVSLDMMVSLLMLGFAYKALEVIQQRDGFVVILTGFLLVGVQFLYAQSMLAALYGIFSLSILISALIAIQQSKSTAIIPNLKLASVMLLLCLPLMITLFIFAPRFSPLWSIALPSSHAKTGITDKMTPGDIAKLSQSDELAFRVAFSGERPVQKELYWRGIVLQHFDGNTWTQFADNLAAQEIKARLRSNQNSIRERLIKKGYGREYEVIYEKSYQSWLFALSPVVDIQGDALYGNDFRIMAQQDVLNPLLLKLTSYPEALREVELPQSSYKQALQLPQHGNKKSKALAQRLFAASHSKQEYIQKVLNRYKQQDYFYTLRPAKLDQDNSIDDFLLNSKRGFCAHYAGSFVFMMRAAGIPARVIAGYQGGEWNDSSNYLAVRQYDAHAWAEVWLENQGWVRLDPTTMVAPERIERNLQTAVEEEGSFLEGSMLAPAKYKWLTSLRQQLDASQYAWRKFVLGYDQEAQSQFIKKIFGEISILKAVLISISIFMSIILLWIIFLGLARKKHPEAIEHQLYQRFCKRLEKRGVSRKLSQTPTKFSDYASGQLPELTAEINEFSRLYSQVCYEPCSQEEKQRYIHKLKEILKSIK